MASLRDGCLPAVLCLLTCAAVRADTITVQGLGSAAIGAAIEQSKPGDTVLLPTATYRLTEAVLPKSGIRVVGAGQEQTVLQFAGEADMVMVSLQGCADVTIADLTLDGMSDPRAGHGLPRPSRC